MPDIGVALEHDRFGRVARRHAGADRARTFDRSRRDAARQSRPWRLPRGRRLCRPLLPAIHRHRSAARAARRLRLFVAALAIPLYRLLLAPLAERGRRGADDDDVRASRSFSKTFSCSAFSADTRSIERDYATLPLTLGPVTVPLIYVIGFAIAVALHPRRALAGLAHRASGATCAPAPSDAQAAATHRRRRQARADADLRAGRGLRGRRRRADRRGVPVQPLERRRLSAQQPRDHRARRPRQRAGHADRRRWRSASCKASAASTLGDGYRDLVGMALFLLVLAFRPDGFLARGRS